MKTTPATDELLKRLNQIRSLPELDRYARDAAPCFTAANFPEYLKKCMSEANITPSQLFKTAQIQRNYGYQILNGMKNPGRDKVIALCLALSLTLAETQRMLTLAKEGILYPKNVRDSILIFCINKHLSVMETNSLLYDRGQEVL